MKKVYSCIFSNFEQKIEDCLYALKQNTNKIVWVYSFAVSGALLLLLFNPMNHTQIEQFNRIIGQGVIYGYDVSRVISNFYIWFILFAILLVVAAIFFSYVRSKEYIGEKQKAWEFLDNFIVIAGVHLVLKAITFFDKSDFSYSSYIIGIIFILVLLYILWKLDKKIGFEEYFSLIIMEFSFAFPIAIILKKPWENGWLLLIIQAILMLGSVIFIKYAGFLKRFWHNRALMISGTIAASFFPLLLFSCIETVNIFVARGIYVSRPVNCYIISICLMCLVAIVLFAVFRNNKSFIDAKKIAFPVLILGIAALSVQIPLTTTYSADLFESANESVLITDFLNFGDVPIVSHYGGHMMRGVWEGIIYGILNNDYVGAAFSPYRSYFAPIIAVLFFFLLKNIWNDKNALWATLLLPFYNSINYYAWGILIVSAVIFYIKKNTYLRAFLIWLACAWCTIYKLDLGYAFDSACVIALICYVISEKRYNALKQLLISFISSIVLFFTLWILLCVQAEVNPVVRLMEFLFISLSDKNWAYFGIGDAGKTLYSCFYIFTPIFVASSLLYIIFSKKFKNTAGTICWSILILLGLAYFTNFARGLVRHSLQERNLFVIVYTSHIFIAAFVSILINRKWFIPLFFALVLVNHSFVSSNNFMQRSLADNAGIRISNTLDFWKTNYWKDIKKNNTKVKRIVIDKGVLDKMQPLKTMVNSLLRQDETYVDFMNRSFTYSYLQRKDPAYVSQSPLQLSGEYTQEQFIREISLEKDINPLVIMPYFNRNDRAATALNGIANPVRYYKVAEYIYQNYVPLCYYGEFAVWCIPERCGNMREKLDLREVECIDNFADKNTAFMAHNLNVSMDGNGMNMVYTGTDPYLGNFGQYIDLKPYVSKDVKIAIKYSSDVNGEMQLFYTENKGEHFSATKCKSYKIIAKEGIAEFVVPVTEYSTVRLDIPEKSKVIISSVKLSSPIQAIDYGYDRIDNNNDNKGKYIDDKKSLHIYNLKKLAQIWGEMDEKKAYDNPVAADVMKMGELYHITGTESIDKKKGNYLLLNAAYTQGVKTGQSEDEAILRLGIMEDGTFIEKYRYTFEIENGVHNYLVRISNDYFWYSEDIDTIKLDGADLNEVHMSILQGD